MWKENFGFAVFCYDDIMKKYEEFVKKWRQVGSPKLYFCTMDIEKCYDSVGREKLIQFMEDSHLLYDHYYVMNCQVLKRRNNITIEGKNFRKKEMQHYFRSRY